jgi:hypothetical protein
MSDSGSTFQRRLIAARGAAWQVFLIGLGLQMLTYFLYLGLGQGGIEGLIESGLYGDVSSDEATHLMLVYVAALKLMNTAILMAALFLTLWVRGLRRNG